MVQMENLGRIIDEHPFFQGIGDKLRTLLVGCAANERFEAGEFIVREGQAADKFYLVRAGSVAVEVDIPGQPPIIVETVAEGEVFGWSWAVAPFRSTFDARANTLVRAISFDGKCLRAKMDKDPALGYEVMRRFMVVMSHRLHSARLQMLDLYGPGARAALEARTPTKPKVEVVRAVAGSKGSNRSPAAKLGASKPERVKALAEDKKPAKDKKDKKPKAAKPKAAKAAKPKAKAAKKTSAKKVG
ncbi:MAG: cyclic nucleotide-binding domain-containing protein [Actinomycetota bacterium]